MKTLVIGYGNDLRSDDGAGRVVADRVARLGLPGVTVRSLSQLVPELALAIAEMDLVVFVDASIEVAETTAKPVVTKSVDGAAATHYADPGTLLGMTAMVGAVPDRAFVVSIPVTDLGLGSELSALAARGVDGAVELISHLIGE